MTIDEVIRHCRQLMYSNDKRVLGDEIIVLLRLAYSEGQLFDVINRNES